MRVVLCCALAAAASTTPVAAAHRFVSVGYRTPAALHGLRVVQRVSPLRIAEVRVANARVAQRLRSRPGIRFVHRLAGRRHAGGPSVPMSSAVVSEWQWVAASEDTVPLWVQQAASRVTIAIVDTGADLTVPALAAKPATTSWDVVSSSATVRDQVGHGTFVASLAGGAVSDPSAMLGFGGEANLMVVQANRGGAGFSDIDEANAIVWAVDHGANIVNLSLGGAQTSVVERSAIEYALGKNVLLVAAAGNAAQQGNPLVYPAALIGDRGLVVGAADSAGRRAAFSTTGSYVDLLAPGVDVLGAVAGGIADGYFGIASTPGASGTYGFGTGTSYAAPEVAGAAALVMAANPGLDALGVAHTLEATASGNGIWKADLAWGNLNVGAAVTKALGGTVPQLVPPTTRARPRTVKPAKSAKTTPAGKKRPKGKR